MRMNLMRITYADSLTRWCATLMKRGSAFGGNVSGISFAILIAASTAGTRLFPSTIECVHVVAWREAADWFSREVSVGSLWERLRDRAGSRQMPSGRLGPAEDLRVRSRGV